MTQSMPRRVRVLVNPHAGRGRAPEEAAALRAALERQGCRVTVERTESVKEAEEAVRRAAESGELLLCCGGDGTLSAAVSCQLRAGLRLPTAYLPRGTTNDFARFMALPADPAALARRLRLTAPRLLDTGRLGDRDFLYVAAFGAFTAASYRTAGASKQALGRLAYLLEGARELPALRCTSLRAVTAEGRVFGGSYLFGTVSNSTSVAGMLRVAPRLVDPADGRLELTLVRPPQSPAQLGRLLYALRRGEPDPELMDFTQTAGVRFCFDAPTPWSLDGEYAPGGRRAQAAVRPRSLSLYC